MMEAKSLAAPSVQLVPISQSRLKQREGADHVRLHELSRTVDRAVDMAFRCEMHDHVRLVLGDRCLHLLSISDIDSHEAVAVTPGNGIEGIEIARIGELVNDENLMRRAGNQLAYDRRPD